jgi:hypothetical protein
MICTNQISLNQKNPKHETRNPILLCGVAPLRSTRTNLKLRYVNVQMFKTIPSEAKKGVQSIVLKMPAGPCFCHLYFIHLNLFRISIFGFRIFVFLPFSGKIYL